MLVVKDLSVGYGEKLVLKKLNLEVANNSIHGVLGMNGAGKTTFFNTVFGMIKAKEGLIQFEGNAVTPSEIAYLETHNYFYPYLKGKEYLQLCSKSNSNFEVSLWNKLFQLPLNQLIDSYSTGMKKKLAFLGIIAMDRPLVILDEPFNGVDLESSEIIYRILDRLRGQNKTILISSHIIETLARTCDHISYLAAGNFQKSYPKNAFSSLQEDLQNLIGQKIDSQLDLLF